MRKFYRECLKQAVAAGVDGAKLENGHRHMRIVGTVSGRSFSCGISCTPGDTFAEGHARREIRRLVRELSK
jgi:hypothetical protein